MQVLLAPVGSHGDVHPFVGLGLALRGRGHRVTFIVNDYFGPLVRGLGFEHVPLGEASLMLEAMRDPDLWHPMRSLKALVPWILEGARRMHGEVVSRYVPGETVVVGGSLALGARLAQETHEVPVATVHLQPQVLYSNFATPVYPSLAIPRWWPKWLKRAFFDLLFGRVADPLIAPGLNAFRAELGLPPVRDVMRTWLHSPRLVLGFFPEWFGPPQPDWPRPLRLVGFPLYDERDASPLTPELNAFLDQGTPPIAFTPGSGNIHGRPFFEAAIDACVRLGRRGLLLTRFPEQVPAGLPDGVIHVAYAPFGQLLPRVSALVHHGGIGTAAQGMAAGIPQLVMPLAHDQYDNAARMQRLGVARSLLPARFRGPAVARALSTLIDRPDVAERCRETAARFAEGPSPMELACDSIETLLPTPRAASERVASK